MLFGNQNNQTSAKKANPFIWALIAVVPLAAFLVRMLPDSEPRAAMKPGLTYSERVRRVEALCESVAKPEEFYLVEKKSPTETARLVSIGYQFRSARAQEELFPTFLIWFASNGWTDNRSPYKPLEFTKGDQTVSIAPVRTSEGDFYLITCTEWITD